MRIEELTRKPSAESLHFDAHEFDGLREILEHEAETAFAKLDQYIRKHPGMCMALAATAGFALVRGLQR